MAHGRESPLCPFAPNTHLSNRVLSYFPTHPTRTICVRSMKLFDEAPSLHGHEFVYLPYGGKSFSIFRARHSLEKSRFVLAAAIGSLLKRREYTIRVIQQHSSRGTTGSSQDVGEALKTKKQRSELDNSQRRSNVVLEHAQETRQATQCVVSLCTRLHLR